MRLFLPLLLFALVQLVPVQSATAQPFGSPEPPNVFTIWPLFDRTVPIYLHAGQHLDVSYTVVNAGRDIDFRIIGPKGDVLQGRHVVDGESSEFSADDDGIYTLEFDNSLSPWHSKTVHFEYSVSPF